MYGKWRYNSNESLIHIPLILISYLKDERKICPVIKKV